MKKNESDVIALFVKEKIILGIVTGASKILRANIYLGVDIVYFM